MCIPDVKEVLIIRGVKMSDDDTYNVVVEKDGGEFNTTIEDVPETMIGYTTESLNQIVGDRDDYEVYVETVVEDNDE